MDNTSKKLFKKSFMGGFKREDVATYIAEISAEHASETRKLGDELKAAENTNQELASANGVLENEKKDLLNRVDDLSVKVSEGDAAKAELLALKEDYANLKAEKEKMAEEIAALKNALSASEAQISQYQAHEQEVRKSKEQIANLELDARNRATQIENEARADMAAEIAEHKAYIESENQKLDIYREETYSKIETLISKMADSYDNTKNAVYDFKTGFKAVVTELARGIDSISDTSLAIEEAFNELKADCSNMREGK